MATFSAGSVSTDVINNTISEFSLSGIQYQQGAGGRVIDNIETWGTTAEINGNTTSDAFEGIRLDGGAGNVTGAGNQVDRTFKGINVPSLSSVMIHESEFTDYLIPLDGANLAAGSLTCNWWGDPQGPQNVPAGLSGDIFTPWLTSPIGPCDGGL